MSAASESLIERITDRRSARSLAGPAPTAEELARMVQAAVTVPDHGGLRPFLFVVVADDARTHFGAALAASCFSSVFASNGWTVTDAGVNEAPADSFW